MNANSFRFSSGRQTFGDAGRLRSRKGTSSTRADPAPIWHAATRAALQFACASFFRYLQNHCLHIDVDAPQNAINPKVLAAFVDHRRKSCSDSAIAIELNHLRLGLGLIFPVSI